MAKTLRFISAAFSLKSVPSERYLFDGFFSKSVSSDEFRFLNSGTHLLTNNLRVVIPELFVGVVDSDRVKPNDTGLHLQQERCIPGS